MTRVLRVDDRLRNLDKPRLNHIDVPSVTGNDIFILCAGFEDRAIETLRRILDSGQKDFEVLIIQYKPFLPGNRFDEIVTMCTGSSISFRVETYDRSAPPCIDRMLYEACRTKKKVYIDISAMSRLLIAQVVVSALSYKELAEKTTIIYAEARQYPPNESEVQMALSKKHEDTIYRTMFVSAGVFEVHVVAELSSVALQGQPIRLVAFPSFNVDQLFALRGSLQPTFYSFLHGIPPRKENEWRMDSIKKLNHTDEILQREDFIVSTLYYEQTLLCLLDIYANHGVMEKIVVSPTGSKMQAVASAIFKAFMRDIQIVYPSPRTFASPHDYTVGVSDVYNLSLKPFSELIPK